MTTKSGFLFLSAFISLQAGIRTTELFLKPFFKYNVMFLKYEYTFQREGEITAHWLDLDLPYDLF